MPMTAVRTLGSLLPRVYQKAECRTSEIHFGGGAVRRGEDSFLAEGAAAAVVVVAIISAAAQGPAGN